MVGHALDGVVAVTGQQRYSTWERPFAPLNPVVARIAEAWFDDAEGLEALGGYPVGLLVGEQPGPTSNPKLPLWPFPPRSAGGRLHAMSGVTAIPHPSGRCREYDDATARHRAGEALCWAAHVEES